MLKKALLSALTISVLAACGSGGGKNVNIGSKTDAPKPTPPSASITGSLLDSKAGKAGSVTATPSSNTMDSIVINGKTIALTQPGIFSKTFNNITSGKTQTVASGTFLSYTRFGAYTDTKDEATGNSNVFAIGQATPVANVPVTGQATYTGQAVFSTSKTNNFDTQKSAEFSVDFGKKTITGSIDKTSLNLKLSGTITGSTFSGDKDGMKMSGSFYGPKAEELSGVFNGTKTSETYLGSFGAKQSVKP